MSTLLLTTGAWTGYRRSRDIYYRLVGKSPLPEVPDLAAEWRAVKGLQQARRQPPTKVQSDADGNNLWDTPLGQMWSPPGMTSYFMSLIAAEMMGGVYDFTGQGSDPIVVDAGANIGFFSRLALSRGAARVIAFEPSPATAVCLRRNLSPWIESGQVTVIQKGLWNEATTLRFSSENASNPGAHHISESGAIEIHTTTLDHCLDELKVSRVDYLKMDIEGAEQNALRAAEKTIRKNKPVCLIAVEHTSDMIKNALAVVDIMKTFNPGYRYVATERHPYSSPSLGSVLCPYTLKFY
jgi:FkbM family methyltransferase